MPTQNVESTRKYLVQSVRSMSVVPNTASVAWRMISAPEARIHRLVVNSIATSQVQVPLVVTYSLGSLDTMKHGHMIGT
jgi:hypothetical protein